jgi:hypothetical protein
MTCDELSMCLIFLIVIEFLSLRSTNGASFGFPGQQRLHYVISSGEGVTIPYVVEGKGTTRSLPQPCRLNDFCAQYPGATRSLDKEC